jgi:uncharacterized membrane protein
MTTGFADYVLLAAQLTGGLLAGLFFAYSVSVMPALKAMPDPTFEAVMNKINVVIVNPVFLAVFLGAPVTAAALPSWERSAYAVAGGLLGVVTLIVTVVWNIPLNNALARGGARVDFERPWVRWNVVRTLTGLASFVCLLLA